MYDALEITEERISTFESDLDVTDYEIGNSRLAITVIMTMSACVGAWGVVCLLSGLASSNFQEIGRSMLTALTGM